MTADVLHLDDYRPTVPELLRCLFCGGTGVRRIVTMPRREYHPCPAYPGCDEVAAVTESDWWR